MKICHGLQVTICPYVGRVQIVPHSQNLMFLGSHKKRDCKIGCFCNLKILMLQKTVFLQNKEGEKMENVKEVLKMIATDKLFWLGLLLGFACGALHHNFGL